MPDGHVRLTDSDVPRHRPIIRLTDVQEVRVLGGPDQRWGDYLATKNSAEGKNAAADWRVAGLLGHGVGTVDQKGYLVSAVEEYLGRSENQALKPARVVFEYAHKDSDVIVNGDRVLECAAFVEPMDENMTRQQLQEMRDQVLVTMRGIVLTV